MRSPLALSDLQLKLLERAASTLPVEQRDSFLQQVALQLCGQPSIPAVETAIDRALATMMASNDYRY
jgi:hypothetical protein